MGEGRTDAEKGSGKEEEKKEEGIRKLSGWSIYSTVYWEGRQERGVGEGGRWWEGKKGSDLNGEKQKKKRQKGSK
jgi:hypothetical protein